MKFEKYTKYYCLVVVLMFTQVNLTAPAKVDSKKEKPPVLPPHMKCDQDIMVSYGMEGNLIPTKMELDMCPTVEMSCCKTSDQLTIYSNWAHGKEEKNLQDRFKYQYNVYSHLLDSLVKVYPIATMIQDKLKVKKVSNCKILARKILAFEVKDMASKLKEAIRGMHEFFFDSYKGMYCVLCAGDTHSFFNLKEKKIIFSERFCRDIVSNTLHPLLYLHIHFTKLLNLVGTFLSSCDNRGRFDENSNLSPKYTFHVTAKARNEVEQCKTFRNDPNWFKMCKPLCENFKLTKFSEFFQPHLKKYRMYSEFLAARIKHIQIQEKNDPLNQKMEARLLEGKNKTTKKMLLDSNVVNEGQESHNEVLSSIHNRKLTAAAPAKAPTKKSKRPSMVDKLKLSEKKWKKLSIFRSALNAIIPIDLFKSDFQDKGIELYEFGKASLIDDSRYKMVKAEIQKQLGKKKKAKKSSGLFGGVNKLSMNCFMLFAVFVVFARLW